MTEYVEVPLAQIRLVGVTEDGTKTDLGEYTLIEAQSSYDYYLSLYSEVEVLPLEIQ